MRKASAIFKAARLLNEAEMRTSFWIVDSNMFIAACKWSIDFYKAFIENISNYAACNLTLKSRQTSVETLGIYSSSSSSSINYEGCWWDELRQSSDSKSIDLTEIPCFIWKYAYANYTNKRCSRACSFSFIGNSDEIFDYSYSIILSRTLNAS